MLDKAVENAVRQAARANNIPEAGLLAVIAAESAGQAFWKVKNKNVPPIRFEGHYFYKKLTGKERDKAVAEGLASPKAGAVPNPRSYAARYDLLERARKINAKAANESTSWGLGQVMGDHWNYLGYKSVDEMVSAAYTIEGQVDMMVRFIIRKNLIVHIRNRDWDKFAYTYNGPGYAKNKYHTKMAEFYRSYSNGTEANGTDANIQLQKMLNAVGDYNLTLDGVVGANTKAAIRDFQIRNGLVVDGIYGPITREALESAYRAKVNSERAQMGGLTVTGGGVGVALTEAAKSLEPLAKVSVWVQIAFIGLILVGAFFTVRSMLGNKGQ